MKVHHILSRVFKLPFIKDVYIFSKEEAVNIQFLLMLEDMKNGRKERHKDYCEIGMRNYSLIQEDEDGKSIPTTPRVLKNDYNLKIEFIHKEKMRMKILDDRGKPYYLRKLDPTICNKEVLINISDWNYGDYNIELTNLLGMTIASGKFEIC